MLPRWAGSRPARPSAGATSRRRAPRRRSRALRWEEPTRARAPCLWNLRACRRRRERRRAPIRTGRRQTSRSGRGGSQPPSCRALSLASRFRRCPAPGRHSGSRRTPDRCRVQPRECRRRALRAPREYRPRSPERASARARGGAATTVGRGRGPGRTRPGSRPRARPRRRASARGRGQRARGSRRSRPRDAMPPARPPAAQR